jgi:hypothetical protein
MDYTPLPSLDTPKSSKKPFILFGILILCSVGLMYFLKNNQPTQKVPDLITIVPTLSPTPILTPAESIEKITYQTYENKKYHFAFDVIKEKMKGSVQTYSLFVEDRGNQIVFSEKTYHDGLIDTRQYAYTLYDATTKDKDDLTPWWTKTIAHDIGGLSVPADYNSQVGYYPDESCIKLYAPQWKVPSNLYITPIDSTEGLGPYTSSIYFYYNFGVPFVMQMQETINGVCGSIDDYKSLMTIRGI